MKHIYRFAKKLAAPFVALALLPLILLLFLLSLVLEALFNVWEETQS
jgi:hypothetical protein